MNWKDFFYFQRSERTAIILLLILILLVVILNLLFHFRSVFEIMPIQNDSLVRKFEEFRQSLVKIESPASEETSIRKSSYRGHSDSVSPARPLPPVRSESHSFTSYPRVEKLAPGETISLNSSDTAEWKKIPGIGSVFASRIVKYRNRLGGFASMLQLLEVYGIDREMFAKITPFITEDDRFEKLDANTLEFKELLRHPYLNYKQVKAITDLRRRKGRIESIRELEMLDEFTTEDIDRLRPYLTFRE